MIILVKNQKDIDIELNDLSGYIIPASGSKDIALDMNINEIAASDHLLELISIGDVKINNGFDDLSKSNAIRYVSLYKHLNPISPDGKETIRAESRPPNTQTNFTMIGDSTSLIHGGKRLWWDFSNDDDIVTNNDILQHHLPIPDQYKRKRIIMQFLDPVYIKEGTLYFIEALKGSYADMSVVCPTNQYYIDANGLAQKATSPICISHYVSNHFFYGTCNIGDELNAETCQENAIPPNYQLWVELTVPMNDNISFGYGSLELYRSRTVML